MKPRVLLVDDVAELRQILRLLLQHSGWFEIVGEAAGGEEAVELAGALRPDLVVLDVEMPGGPTGWQVLPRIKEVAPDTSVVILSGSPSDESAPGKEALAAAVVQKGLPPQELIGLLLGLAGAAPQRLDGSSGPQPVAVPEGVAVDPAQVAPEWIAHDEVEARLVALVASASDAIISKSLTGEILSWNPAATRMYGYAPAEAIGRSITMLVPPDRRGEVTRILQRIAAGERVERFETVRVRRDGTTLDVELTVSPVLDGTGRVIGASTIARDITGRRESDAALSWALAQLEQRNRELRRSNDELDSFASVASHDLAQPLQVAYGYLEMVRTEFGATIDPTALAWLDAAATSLERMRELVHDILGFARTGDRDFVPEPVSLTAAAAEAVAGLAPLIEERGAHVEVVPLPEVSGNEAQLTQLLRNLIANGVKYVPPGVDPVVTISSEETHDAVVVSVDDNGASVPAAQRERIFEMFRRAHGSEVSGTGLGLAICRKVVARHGGRIWAEEAPGGGARFRFLLPRVVPGAAATDFGNSGPLT